MLLGPGRDRAHNHGSLIDLIDRTAHHKSGFIQTMSTYWAGPTGIHYKIEAVHLRLDMSPGGGTSKLHKHVAETPCASTSHSAHTYGCMGTKKGHLWWANRGRTKTKFGMWMQAAQNERQLLCSLTDEGTRKMVARKKILPVGTVLGSSNDHLFWKWPELRINMDSWAVACPGRRKTGKSGMERSLG